ncbi:NEW3 domain-containing protein [Alistipes onderdonkii]|uniref:COG1470 family protein n=1 Tax=Alistipes onderdonkii TaxID=328813 RepID=UPI0003AA68E3|nr:NEW3 domain-containing protein [Alistipes onderdonkii]UWN61357.1 NEW3 domain-containing protein [Alistipes onderdonkii]
MTMRTNYLLFFAVLLGAFPAAGAHAAADSLSTGVVLYSPYTKIVVSPGASINYSVDLINNGHEIRTENIALGGLPSSWKYDIKSGGWNIEQMAVLPDEKKNFTLTVNVPLKINKGSYKFHLSAGEARLPLTIVVSKQGTYQSEFTTDQPNMQGNSKSNFTFSTTLRNQTADRQLYALMADAPRGWNVVFKPNYKQATSAQVDANASQNISVEVTPAANAEAGTYKIPVRAVTNSTSAELTLEVAITGTFQMEVTTPKGLLSADITAGDTRRIDLEVVNTGSSELKDIQLSSRKLAGWELSFEPSKIASLKAGAAANVTAELKASPKALPGDYVVVMDAKTPEVTADAQFRISVKTPLFWGWVGVLVILAAVGGVYCLFRKYGRR